SNPPPTPFIRGTVFKASNALREPITALQSLLSSSSSSPPSSSSPSPSSFSRPQDPVHHPPVHHPPSPPPDKNLASAILHLEILLGRFLLDVVSLPPAPPPSPRPHFFGWLWGRLFGDGGGGGGGADVDVVDLEKGDDGDVEHTIYKQEENERQERERRLEALGVEFMRRINMLGRDFMDVEGLGISFGNVDLEMGLFGWRGKGDLSSWAFYWGEEL
ncbi:MAG: hypothetical protein Q9216_004503, partial [Gyalolechia sp. 2 TL-2023]